MFALGRRLFPTRLTIIYNHDGERPGASADDDNDDDDDDDTISAVVARQCSIPAARSLRLIASALFADWWQMLWRCFDHRPRAMVPRVGLAARVQWYMSAKSYIYSVRR